ncbi:hypothetical protein B0A48_02558 [Cryoendolithus antarcticus]|uniref:Molybdenum cofactor sulfurase n=1 Tax=Cryoendolithus antarcticus TaxID=1507870 RepID=A0A1V8TP48_9PEZI|nr:hypothetical protein B0A48_02558 [Cryoendolithus antarcticus]
MGKFHRSVATSEPAMEYNDCIARMREEQYPMLAGTTYLDHAGTTPYSKKLMDRFSADMMGSLFGNPHSASHSSQHSTQMIDDTRLQLLRLFQADPEEFDVVFTANATAAIKLVIDAFRDQDGGFWYGYHVDSHTSLVGVREVANGHKCFESDQDVERWIEDGCEGAVKKAALFAYPAQSNMNGRRLPLRWSSQIRDTAGPPVYILLDAAALTSTSPLDLRNSDAAPDFTALSLYKIFGFPDLGALIVRKEAAHVFAKRAYFGGGTVEMVVCLKETWHAKKTASLHEQLEDGTLPVHSILALRVAMETHAELYGTLERVSRHTAILAERLYEGLRKLKHANRSAVAQIYKDETSNYSNSFTQGPIVAFNLRDSHGKWVSNTEVEKLASIKEIQLRVGGLCNPGGIATALHLEPWEMRDNFSAGQKCGGEHDILNGKPTGMIRASLGAMSTLGDVEKLLSFVDEFFVERMSIKPPVQVNGTRNAVQQLGWHVEALTVYPLKSCGGWQIPSDTAWDIRPEGLAWDREWCIVHQGTGVALSQKRYPRMALIRPHLDFKTGKLRITQADNATEVSVSLSLDPSYFDLTDLKSHTTQVCGDTIKTRIYTSPAITDFFTDALGVPCTLARFPTPTSTDPSTRHSKPQLSKPASTFGPSPLLLPNESPILAITRPSLNALNTYLKLHFLPAAPAAQFRANIILAQSSPAGSEVPWDEDTWRSFTIASDKGVEGASMDVLGGCRRCGMVCVDQTTGIRAEAGEPFVSLAKMRRVGGRVLFGVHCALRGTAGSVRVGQVVETTEGREEG